MLIASTTPHDRSALRLQATDLNRFCRRLDGESPALIGGPLWTLVWQLIDGQDRAVAADLLSGTDVDVSDLLFDLGSLKAVEAYMRMEESQLA